MKLTLPTCESCGSQLTWTQALRAQRFFYEYTHCPYCEEKQFITGHKIAMFLIPLVSVLPLTLNLFVDVTAFGFLSMYAVMLPTCLIASPFAYSLKSKDPQLPIKS